MYLSVEGLRKLMCNAALHGLEEMILREGESCASCTMRLEKDKGCVKVLAKRLRVPCMYVM